MLPSLQEDESIMESGRVTQRLAASVDSSAGPSSTNTSTSTSPSSSISDSLTIEHAKETGFSSIIPQLKHEEPEICKSFASLPFPDSETSRHSEQVTQEGTPTIEKREKQEITGPIPLSRLFDFDKEDQESDLIVRNESERQYQQKLRDEFDAGFEGIDGQMGVLGDDGDNDIKKSPGFTNGHSHAYDSDDEEIRIDDDDDDDEIHTTYRRSKQSLPPPPPPPPIGPPSIKHLPSALDDAQSTYQQIEYNLYRGPNTGNSPVDDCLPCQCKYNPHRDPRWKACGPDCINRNLLVECIEDDCPCGSYCLNRRFQTKQNAHVDVVRTEKKGYGLRAMEGLPPGTFVMEYIGEVLPHSSFVKRTREYSLAGVEHFYFMSLQSDEVIDATKKGCLARFINHSCNPNCHLEKWVVGSKLRIGIFTIKRVAEGEELTFDYQFERYGAEAQKCYCGELNCTGFIGGNKRSSAARFDSYNNLDEVEDEDEIDLENQMSLRLPKKDKGNDGDYEDEYEQRKITRGIEDPFLVEKLARIMFMKPKVQKSKRLLAKLVATTERACLRRFLVLHGLVILKAWLKHYKDEPDIIMGIMHVLPNIPLLSRNAIEDSQIEEAIQEIVDGPDSPIKIMAQEVLTQWKELKPTYRIPKAKKSVTPAVTDAVSTPIDEPSSFMSPAESNGSGSGEGLGKRQYDDEDRASTPAGMEKRGKFEGQVAPSEEIDPSSAQTDATRYHNYHYDSPEYSRSDSHRDHYGRLGEGYGREGGYGRIDYGRHEPHSREGSHGRSGDPGYGRTDSYGRMDPYGMSKSSYERGRYEHYRSDRERERERYYDYYREREYDREYRNHRDPRELRDMRDPRDLRDDRDREYRDLREYREPRDLYTHPPPSPRPRNRDGSPSAGRRERSPSASTQLGSWPGDESRPASPSKARTNPADQSQIQSESSKVAAGVQDAEVAENNTSTLSAGILPVVSTEEMAATVLPTTIAQVAPTPLRSFTQPSDHPEVATSLPAVDSTVSANTPTSNGPSSATTPVSQHPTDYSYRSSGPHGDYSHSRYSSHSGGYHHPQYYRHPSSYHYKSHYSYRGPTSRPYSSPNYPAPAAELPPNWAKATDPEGRIYYYNEITRATQWDPPRADPPAPASAAAVLDPTTQAPTSHFSQPHAFLHQQHQQHQQQQHQPIVPRAATPEPPKPVNIDGFTQEQLQEVIGRAYDKQKQKNLANGIGSAGASVHDVDSPSTRGGNMHSPSMTRIGKPLKAMNEKDLKAAISAYVVKNMAKYKTKLETSEAFKKHARRITHLIADKEMRSKTFKAGELSEITPTMKNKIRRFIKDYMTKLIKKQQKEERSSSSTAALVNGSKNTISHVIVLGADGVPVPPHRSILGSKELSSSGFLSSGLTSGNKKDKPAGADKKMLGYGDVDVDDDDDVKYGEGDDGDDDEGEMDGEDDDDDAGVAAVPSSSVELPL